MCTLYIIVGTRIHVNMSNVCAQHVVLQDTTCCILAVAVQTLKMGIE